MLPTDRGVRADSPHPLHTPTAPATGLPGAFANPLYRGADPWVVRHGGWYYLCQAGAGGRIDVYRSASLAHRGQRSTVWTPPARGWNRDQVWAPELHRIDGRWYIYYAASSGSNATHRMGVLEGTSDDPQGPFVDRGALYTGDDIATGARNRWAIDGTVLQLRGRLYFLWSGWADERDVQWLYIAEMSDPLAISSNRVRLCANDDYAWEHVGESRRQRGLNEGPQVLQRNGKVFVVYSCSGSWQHTYKLGLLHLDEAADPMRAENWSKLDRPVFQSTGEVFGVGHCCFTTSPDGLEDWIVYHSKTSRSEGWDRVVRAQPFGWDADGFPDFGEPARNGRPVALPSGTLTPGTAARILQVEALG